MTRRDPSMKDSCADVLAFLRVRGEDGATEEEIQRATALRSGGQRVHELRRIGFDIRTVMEHAEVGAPFARWYLHERPEPTRGTQEGLSL